jgi:hypothetical protein
MAGLSYDGGRAELSENLHVSPFNKDLSNHGVGNLSPELVLLNVYGAQELMPRHQFRQPM